MRLKSTLRGIKPHEYRNKQKKKTMNEEEYEELDVLETIQDDHSKASASPKSSSDDMMLPILNLLDDECGRINLKHFMEINEKSSTPKLLFDSDLKIQWANTAYRDFRETPGIYYNYERRTFDDFYTTFSDGSDESLKKKG